MRLYLDSNNVFWIENKIITDKIEFIKFTEKKFNIRKLNGDSLLPTSRDFFDMDEFNVERENGSSYATTDEIFQALQSYLTVSSDEGVSNSGASYTPYIVPLEQIDGRLVFEVPFAVDLAQDTIVVEGKFTHTPSVDYTVTNVAGKGNFAFTAAPTEQLVIRYIKK